MTYQIVPCPKCYQLHGVVAVPTTARASRSIVDLSADSATGDGREREVPGRRSSGNPDVRPAVTGTPVPVTASRQRSTPRVAGGSSQRRSHQRPTGRFPE